MQKEKIKKAVVSALFLALGLVLPFLTGQLQAIGSMLLPMHLPVFLCGLICGWQYGLAVGFTVPIMRSLIFGMPVLYPNALAMSLELAAYGAVAGALFLNAKWQCVRSLYRCLIAAMLAGRAVWAVAEVLLLGIGENGFTFKMFISGALLNSIPGIVLQLVLIPAIMLALDKTHLVPFRKSEIKTKARES